MKDCILSSKEILIAYVSTLTDSQCKTGYKLLTNEFEIDRTSFLRFNGKMERTDDGFIKLKKSQLTRLLKTQGEFKLRWMFNVLHNYLYSLYVRGQNGDTEARRKLRNYNTSCYDQLMRGWCQDRFNEEKPIAPDSTQLADFQSISNEKEALEYAQSVPLDFACDSPELTYLANKYKSVNEYIRSLNID